MVISINVSVSNPGIFNSLTLTASIGGSTIGSSTVSEPEIATTTTFTISPPVTIPPGGEALTLTLSGVISGGQMARLDARSSIRLASLLGSGAAEDFDGAGTLMFAFSLLGFAMLPLSSSNRRRITAITAVIVMFSAIITGCGGSSGGATPPSSSHQQVVAMGIREGDAPVAVSGLPSTWATSRSSSAVYCVARAITRASLR